MAGSLSVPVRKAVIAGLRTHLEGLPAFNATAAEDEVAVEYAFGFGQQHRQRIYTGRSSADTGSAGMRAGRNFRNEVGTFALIVRVEMPDTTQEEADTRVDEIGVQVEEWIADRKSDQLGIGLTSLYVTGWSGDYFGVTNGAGSIRQYNVRWTARLT